MWYLIIYLGICILGGLCGHFLKSRKEKLFWTSKIQMGMLILLLFIMGARLGVNKQVIANIGTIGITAFILTIFVLIGSVLAVYLMRILFKMDDRGNVK